ncbi:multidrug resistance regulator 1 [[Candida] railenensis]|uniref:Multidrug resistance regulator 1 n=1 Tax=[Candida] railenensis TaxID=45579 RepID=A0A9P0QTT7_9ASCO|nr:multidrug resistance regulator 1 [[Candida] railenensis]
MSQNTTDKPIRKRNRPTVVCNNCRVKKTKCDRKLPCSNCEKLDLAGSCNYNGSNPSKRVSEGPGDTLRNPLIPSPPHYHHSQQPAHPQVPLPGIALPLGAGAGHAQFSAAPAYVSQGAYHTHIIPPLSQPVSHDHQQPGHGYGSDPTVHNELENLKNKLKELEASITVATLHKSSAPSSVSGTSGAPVPLATSFSSAVSPSIHSSASVGINSNSPIQSSASSTPNVANLHRQSKQSLNHSSYERHSRVDDSTSMAINPYLSDETINFFLDFSINGANKNGYNYKPLPLMAATRADPAIELFLKFKKQLMKEAGVVPQAAAAAKCKDAKGQSLATPQCCSSKVSGPAITHLQSTLSKSDDFLSKVKKDKYSKEYMQKFFGVNRDVVVETMKEHQNIKKFGMSIGVVFDDRKIMDLKGFKEKILAVMPSRRILHALIDRYFSVLYQFLPIVDEYSFRPELKRIIGQTSELVEGANDSITNLNLTKKSDYIFICMTLIMLRLSYISLFKNNQRVNESAVQYGNNMTQADVNTKFLLTNPISVDTIEVAELCLREFDFTRKANLITFQYMLMLKSYRSYCPEDGYKIPCQSSSLFKGLINSLAFSLGLNRDPDFYNSSEGMHGRHTPEVDPRMDNLRRKLWHFLVAQDVVDSITQGTSVTLQHCEYDTKLPFSVDGNANVFDINIEMEVVSSFQTFETLRQSMIDLVQVLFNQRVNIAMSEFTKIVSRFEILLNSECGKLEEYLNPSFNSSRFLKILRLKFLIIGNQLMISIYYLLYLYYLKKDSRERSSGATVNNGFSNLTYFYYKKLLVYALVKVLPYLPDVLDESRDYHHSASSFFISPTIQDFNHSASFINSITVAKLLSTIKILKNNPSHEDSLKSDLSYRSYFDGLHNFMEVVISLRKVNLKVMDTLGVRYFHAWKTRKIHTLCFQLFEKDNFFQYDLDVTRHAAASFELHEMSEMAKVCQTTLEYVNFAARNANTSNNAELPNKDIDARVDSFWQYVASKGNDDEEAPLDDIEEAQGADTTQNNYERGEITRNDSSATESVATLSDSISLDRDFENSLDKPKGSPSYALPFTPQFDFPVEYSDYDLGIFNGQSFDDFFSN